MRHTIISRRESFIERFSTAVGQWAGSTTAFALACAVVAGWALTGPIFDYSNTWQLVINTGTTIVTFLMVFLIQRSQNKESLAVQLKLNELVAAIEGASNRLIDCEDLTEDELNTLHKHYAELVKFAKAEAPLSAARSLAEAQQRHARKVRRK
jgi:low affinity Fe/Cu permease